MFHNALLNEDLQDKCFDVLAVGFCAGGIAVVSLTSAFGIMMSQTHNA